MKKPKSLLTLSREKTLTYDQTLKLVERFIKETKIREFCSNYCKGRCCTGCNENSDIYENKASCMDDGIKRLACSVYLCTTIYQIAFGPNNKLARQYSDIRNPITDELFQAGKHLTPRRNPFFEVDEKVLKYFKTLRFPKKTEELIPMIDKVGDRVQIAIVGAYNIQNSIQSAPGYHRFRGELVNRFQRDERRMKEND